MSVIDIQKAIKLWEMKQDIYRVMSLVYLVTEEPFLKNELNAVLNRLEKSGLVKVKE